MPTIRTRDRRLELHTQPPSLLTATETCNSSWTLSFIQSATAIATVPPYARPCYIQREGSPSCRTTRVLTTARSAGRASMKSGDLSPWRGLLRSATSAWACAVKSFARKGSKRNSRTVIHFPTLARSARRSESTCRSEPRAARSPKICARHRRRRAARACERRLRRAVLLGSRLQGTRVRSGCG